MSRSIVLALSVLCLALSSSSLAQPSGSDRPAPGERTSLTPRVLKLSASLSSDPYARFEPGLVGVIFSLYKERDDQIPLWVETQNVTIDEQGRFTVLLGDPEKDGIPLELFRSGEARWLGIQRIPEREGERIMLASVPYALKAADAETLGGKPLSAFVLSDENGGARGSGAGKGGRLRVAPMGAAGHIARFVDSTNIDSATLFQMGGNRIGLNTTTPQVPLHIFGVQAYRNLNLGSLQTGAYPGIMLENTITNSTVALTENSGLYIYTKPSSTDPILNAELRMVVSNTGNVGIGTDAPSQRLDVVGSVKLSDNLALPITASAGTAGVITLGGVRFAHNFGPANAFIGNNAGNFTMTGVNNNAIGGSALASNTIGNFNNAIGRSALLSNTTGGTNNGMGDGALASNTTGFSNTATGDFALLNNTTGGGNIAVGANAGRNLTIGNNNIDIGNSGIAGESGTIRIGTSATHTRAFLAGVRGVTTGVADGLAVLIDSAGQLGTISSSARVKREIAGIGGASSALLRLRPVSFFYRNDAVGIRQYGLIAEEVAEAMPELVQFSPAGEPETVRYHFLAPLLLNELQKQQRRIEEQQRTIEDQQHRLGEQSEQLTGLHERLRNLESAMQSLTAAQAAIVPCDPASRVH